jgi:hypothetical protein
MRAHEHTYLYTERHVFYSLHRISWSNAYIPATYPGTNIDHKTGYPDLGFALFFSVPTGKHHDSTLS